MISYLTHLIKFRIVRRVTFFALIHFFVSCQTAETPGNASYRGKTIAVSKFYSDSSFRKWLQHTDPSLQFVELYGLKGPSLDSALALSSGVLLTGGCDVDPRRYERADLLPFCGELDSLRDEIEFAALAHAFKQKKPLLGVCRGLQIMNVFLGGSLIADIPAATGSTIHQSKENDTEHDILLVEGSPLTIRTALSKSNVNSNHHQAIEILGNDLQIMAYAPDSVIEAIWYSGHPDQLAFGVQWHPERMDWNHELSRNIAKMFLEQVWKFR
jgi:putative glutamine amidotransferase